VKVCQDIREYIEAAASIGSHFTLNRISVLHIQLGTGLHIDDIPTAVSCRQISPKSFPKSQGSMEKK